MRKHLLLARVLPITQWSRNYSRDHFAADSIAAAIVFVMMVPQAMGLALIAGLPPETGLYASILGLSIYAVFGTSNTLSVGPVAVLSLMTAAALAKLNITEPAEYLAAALCLTFLSGGFLFLLGVFRLGFMANFLSHPVISAFITASALLIGLSQLKHLFGIEGDGQTAPNLIASLVASMPLANRVTLLIGTVSIVSIFLIKFKGVKVLAAMGCSQAAANFGAKLGPVIVVVLSSWLAYALRLDLHGVDLLGEISRGLPNFKLPSFSTDLVLSLWGSAAFIAIIGFVESISVAQTLAAKRRERIDLDQELVGLGAANMATSCFGGFPVSGGFSRSVVNFEAGALTPAASLITALFLVLAALFLTPLLFWLPKVSLAAIILVAVQPLIDFSILKRSWLYAKADFTAVCLTLFLTLLVGVEIGIAAGVLASVLIHLYKTSKPHVAVVGRVPGTEHFRSVKRHEVAVFSSILSIRIDESLYFANTRYLEELIFKLVADQSELKHVILMCPAVNKIDMSALDTLSKINEALHEIGISLHLSEVKGPIMDRLALTDFFKSLSGQHFMSHNQAIEALRGDAVPILLSPKQTNQ